MKGYRLATELAGRTHEIRKGDILIINTGYHKYGFDQPTADERRYMLRHPGPSMDFV
ncbi:cyclase family protein, partial [Anaerotruncus colihominis]|uniref:cyclase family protein n=1 Tax=Anaerotruncus colihominis TaxID=169435 RepID=UPI0034E53AF1